MVCRDEGKGFLLRQAFNRVTASGADVGREI